MKSGDFLKGGEHKDEHDISGTNIHERSSTSP